MQKNITNEKQFMNFETYFKLVFGEPGFATSTLSQNDLIVLRSLVEEQFRATLSSQNEHANSRYLDVPITNYHEISDKIDHENLWKKNNRIFTKELLDKAMKLDFFKELKNEIGDILISDEEEIGYPEIYWRLVRPLPYKDIGPIHADAWFWDLGHGFTPKGHQRIKFWFSLYNETGQNGFCYVPSSHKQNFEYQSETRHGFKKPVFDVTKHDLNIQIFKSNPGDFIIFNDKLLHGGKAGGNQTRVSIEFTLFVNDNYLKKIGINL